MPPSTNSPKLEQNTEEIFGFPIAPALELAGAMEHLRSASHGRIGGEDSMLGSMMELLPAIERIQAGETDISELALPEQSADFIPRVEPYVEVLERFDNPRKTFVKEIGRVASAIIDDAENTAARAKEAKLGITRVANSIHGVLGDLIERPEDESRALPMLSGVVMARKHRPKPLKLPPMLILTPVAPDILAMLEAPLAKSRQRPQRIESLRKSTIIVAVNQVPRLRDDFEAVRLAAPVLLTSVRDLLPTEGAEVRERFEAVKEFLEA